MSDERAFVRNLTHPNSANPLAELFARQRGDEDAEAARAEIRAIAADTERRSFIRQLTGTTTTKEN
ncbi:MAG: hypothetical protein ACTHU1_13295 [Arachnia sp.]